MTEKQLLATKLAATERKIRAFYVSTYIPRECGIATFTKDLTNAINLLTPTCLADIAAIDDSEGHRTEYNYPWEVKQIIRQNNENSWIEVAKHINETCADIVSIQFEFGIYGPSGSSGAHIIPFLKALKKPAVVTLHTVLPRPSDEQKRVMQEIAKRVEAIVVMVNVAVKWLSDAYGIDSHKVVVIPHGVPDIPFTPSDGVKKELGLGKNNVIMGFGLIGRGKGYEQAIMAMPEILKKHPHTKLVIVGETHPVVKKKHGEKYRDSLKRLAKKYGVSDSLVWVNRYLSLDEIIEYLKATDIYITPFINLDQITSGTLSYALGAGRACVSTRYLYAEEVLAENRGILTDHSPKDFAKAVIGLLDHPRKAKKIAQTAYDFGRNMIWPSVALKYLDLFDILKKTDERP